MGSRTAMAVGLAALVLLVPALVLAQRDANRGNDLYHKNCAACHGEAGKGDGPAAAALNPKPKDLADKAYMATLSDKYLLDLVRKGGTGMGKSPLMPPMGSALTDDQIQDVIAYLRSLAR